MPMESRAKTETQDALFAHIKTHADAVIGSGHDAVTTASILKNLALAYRYAAGGPQPGSD